MKIQKITIHNIASIEDATIDFEAAPLAGSDIFLITGNTGSGKSTILDAICLALYGTTPRMENLQMQGKIREHGKEVGVKDPSRLLREGKGEGSVILDFQGINGHPYQATWSIARANKTADGRIQGKKWELRDLQTGHAFSKDSDISAEIKVATGLLSFDQFCRTTVLAQGAFTKFLDSKDDEKAGILEKITGVEIYSKIGKQIFQIYSEKEKAYQAARQAAEGVELLSDEQIAEKEEEKKKLEADSVAASDESKVCQEKITFLDNKMDLDKKIEEAKKALGVAQEKASAESVQEDTALVEAFRETQEVRRSLAEAGRRTAEAHAAEEKIGKLSTEYVCVRAGKEALVAEKEGINQELAVLCGEMDQDMDILPVISQAQTAVGHVKTIVETKGKITGWETENKETTARIEEMLTPAQVRAQEAYDKAKAAKEAASKAVIEAEKALADAGLDEIREQISTKRELRNALERSQDRLKDYHEAAKIREEERKGIEADEKAIRGLDSALGEAEKTRAMKEEVFQAAEALYEKVKTAEETRVAQIRSTLSVGDVCPVCRQKITEALPTDTEVSAVILPVKESFESAKSDFEEAEKAARLCQNEKKLAEKALTERKSRYDRDKTLSAKESSLLEALRKCGIDSIGEKTGEMLTQMRSGVDEEIKVLEDQEKTGKELEVAVNKARVEEKNSGKILEAVQLELETAKRNVTEAQQKIAGNQRLIDDNKATAEKANSSLAKLLVGSRWENTWEADLEAFKKELSEAIDKHNRDEDRKRELTEDIKKKEALIESVTVFLSQIEGRRPDWKTLPGVQATPVESILEKASGLKDDLILSLQTAENASNGAEKENKKVDEFLSGHPSYTRESLQGLSIHTEESIKAKEEALKALREELQGAHTVLETHRSSLNDLLKYQPEIPEGETVETLTVRKEEVDKLMTDAAGKVAVIEAELLTDQQNRKKQGSLVKKANDLLAELNGWKPLREAFGAADGAPFRKIAQSYILGSLVEQANYFMKALSDRYTLKVHPGTFIIELEDAYQGFASRPATTISGGETFLVSLSLALALAEIGEGLAVDTLFIDEGFGTLSGDPLQKAINMLKTLPREVGRHVGIISHIEEVREKIPVKIILEQNGHDSASRVRIENDSI